MQEMQCQNHFRAVETRPILVEFSRPLNLEHEIAAVDIFHHEEKSVLGLETRMQGGQEWVVGRQRQDALFRHGALNVVVLDDDVLFEDFDGKDFFRVPLFCQQLCRKSLCPRL